MYDNNENDVFQIFQNLLYSEKLIEREIDSVLKAYNVSSIIVGHTPYIEGIKIKYNSKIFNTL
jgi:hypothetical protein